MRLAILGARGIPARYSGFDTLVEELAYGLATDPEYEVLVYCRRDYYIERPKNLNGVRLIYLPTSRIKGVESLVHSFLSSLHVLTQKIDIVYFVDPGNAPFCMLLRLFGKPVVLHTDGLGWKRNKWGPFARWYYRYSEQLCAIFATALVTDNPVMRDYYRKAYDAHSMYIPYGAASRYGTNNTTMERYNLNPGKYLLIVARLEPENNVKFIIEEYVRTTLEMPLVVVGDAPYNSLYMHQLKNLADKRVRFLGRIHEQDMLNALYQGAFLYIHGHEVGGTNPSLLRAMDAGAAPLVHDVPFNQVVIGSCGFTFPRTPGALTQILIDLSSRPEDVAHAGNEAKERANQIFRWEKVIQMHKRLLQYVEGSFFKV